MCLVAGFTTLKITGAKGTTITLQHTENGGADGIPVNTYYPGDGGSMTHSHDGKTVPLPCVSTAFAAKPVPCLAVLLLRYWPGPIGCAGCLDMWHDRLSLWWREGLGMVRTRMVRMRQPNGLVHAQGRWPAGELHPVIHIPRLPVRGDPGAACWVQGDGGHADCTLRPFGSSQGRLPAGKIKTTVFALCFHCCSALKTAPFFAVLEQEHCICLLCSTASAAKIAHFIAALQLPEVAAAGSGTPDILNEIFHSTLCAQMSQLWSIPTDCPQVGGDERPPIWLSLCMPVPETMRRSLQREKRGWMGDAHMSASGLSFSMDAR